VSVGIEVQWCGSVSVVAEFSGVHDKRFIVWYVELPVERVSAVTAGCVTFVTIVILLGCQSVNYTSFQRWGTRDRSRSKSEGSSRSSRCENLSKKEKKKKKRSEKLQTESRNVKKGKKDKKKKK
jgi:hypothetical protein